jgi:hypothetical protein
LGVGSSLPQPSGETIDNWRGEPIEIARSPSGVVLVRDYVDNLIRSPEVPWPPPALVSKLVADDRVAARWPPTLADAMSRRLGHYTPLQSIHSEDAITWSFFGPLMHAAGSVRAAFMRWLLERLQLAADDTMAAIDLWRRIPHPEKPSAPGPELDALLRACSSNLIRPRPMRSGSSAGRSPSST